MNPPDDNRGIEVGSLDASGQATVNVGDRYHQAGHTSYLERDSYGNVTNLYQYNNYYYQNAVPTSDYSHPPSTYRPQIAGGFAVSPLHALHYPPPFGPSYPRQLLPPQMSGIYSSTWSDGRSLAMLPPYNGSPRFQPLPTTLTDLDARRIVDAIGAEGVSYSVAAGSIAALTQTDPEVVHMIADRLKNGLHIREALRYPNYWSQPSASNVQSLIHYVDVAMPRDQDVTARLRQAGSSSRRGQTSSAPSITAPTASVVKSPLASASVQAESTALSPKREYVQTSRALSGPAFAAVLGKLVEFGHEVDSHEVIPTFHCLDLTMQKDTSCKDPAQMRSSWLPDLMRSGFAPMDAKAIYDKLRVRGKVTVMVKIEEESVEWI
ncbi:hypothetical protein B0A48_10831 [Cryoendolithus antarcticus]|uniref:Uncharacterized protein n=1 Tax=Cryoendolithus antarcticus TaxID=1507870 RepID=A0A1V8SYX6_9PEZI|nr:hypothetical protein B0A48_10831 [Cryoendolithus antarcticus]